jgi:hypothetical protein
MASRLPALMLIVATAAACGGDKTPSAPTGNDRLSASASTAHIDFILSEGDSVDAERQEAYHVWATAQLGVELPRKLQYRKYRDRSHMERINGRQTNGFAEPPSFIVHSIWPFDPHEAAHVYSAMIGVPSDFFNEGIAVAMAVDPQAGNFVSLWNVTPIHMIARDAMRSGQLPPVASMMTTEGFQRLQQTASYPLAGSFVDFLLGARGMSALQTFFRSSTRADSAGTVESRFAAAFGLSIAAADAEWRALLATV